MQKHSRTIMLGLALVALGASIASLYVHYKLLTDLTYTSFCDVSETVNCEAVYQSPYGTLFGVPVAAFGAIWSAFVVLLTGFGMTDSSSEPSRRTAGYVFLSAVVGMATVLYFAYTSFFVLGKVCLLCMTVYVAVTGIFLLSSSTAADTLSVLPSRLGADLRAVFTSPFAVGLAVLWLAGSASLVAFFPREAASASQTSAGATPAPAPPIEALTEAQLAEWHAWLDAQPRETEASLLPAGPVKVLVVKFNDFQCPACRAAYMAYKDIIAKWEASNPGVFTYQNRDFPLESECGAGGIHQSACEGAVAVRLAKGVNKGKEMEEWLFDRQAEITPALVKQGLAEVANITTFDAEYPKVLELVRADSRLGQQIGVNGTPTFYINGIKVPSLRPAYFNAAIEYLLKKQG